MSLLVSYNVLFIEGNAGRQCVYITCSKAGLMTDDLTVTVYSVVITSQFSQVLVNRGLLYLDLKDHINALFDFIEAGKVS